MNPEVEVQSQSKKASDQVFISYAREDVERVMEIARLLESKGISVWRDCDRILGGQYYGEQIVHAITHSSIVLLMCSPHSLNSDNVHREIIINWEFSHRHYVPIWLTPPTSIPGRFQFCLIGCQWIDASSKDSSIWLPELLRALDAHGTRRSAAGVETDKAGGEPPASTNAQHSPASNRPRFKPGDRPLQGSDWQLVSLLGKGGFGEVWKAINPELPSQQPVALKFCFGLDKQSRDLLRHEAEMVLRAQQHLQGSGFVPLLHAYLNGDPPCLEYPYIAGGTLAGIIEELHRAAKPPSPNQLERVVLRIAEIIGAAHSATPKLVHRDLKPSNILVERTPNKKLSLRITDFGIGGIAASQALEKSRSGSHQASMASMLTGAHTPLYASPQQVRGDKPAPTDDVYSIGVIWYQLLAGDLSVAAPTGTRWVSALQQRGVTVQAISLLASCFEFEPSHRPPDAVELANRIHQLARDDSSAMHDSLEMMVWNSSTGQTESLPITRGNTQVSDAPKQGPAPAAPSSGLQRKRKQIIGAGVAVLVLTVLLGPWAVIGLRGKAILVLEVNEPGAQLFVDGNALSVSWTGGGKTAEIHLEPGDHKVQVKKDGFAPYSEQIVIARNDRLTLSVKLNRMSVAGRPGSPLPELNQVLIALMNLNYEIANQPKGKGKTDQKAIQAALDKNVQRLHAIQELKLGMEAIAAGKPDREIMVHLGRTDSDIDDLAKNSPRKRAALQDTLRKLRNAIKSIKSENQR